MEVKTTITQKVNLNTSKKSYKKLNVTPYLFIAPHLFFFSIFLVIPTFYGIYLSFHQWDFFTEPVFVGFQNFADLLFNKDSLYYADFWNAFGNTVLFVALSVPPLIIIPLLVAIAVDTKTWGNNLFRTIFYTPSLFSIATVALIWIWMLDTNAGLVNYYINKLGFENIPWLTDLPWAWVSLVVMTIWWTMGYNMLLFLAGLQDIPQHLYEAAKIDGANAFQRFFHVTLPGLKGTMFFVVIMTTIASFNLFGQPYMATKGGPGQDTVTLLMYIQRIGFGGGSPDAGVASAMAIIMGIFLSLVSIVQFKIMNRKDKSVT